MWARTQPAELIWGLWENKSGDVSLQYAKNDGAKKKRKKKKKAHSSKQKPGDRWKAALEGPINLSRHITTSAFLWRKTAERGDETSPSLLHPLKLQQKKKNTPLSLSKYKNAILHHVCVIPSVFRATVSLWPVDGEASQDFTSLDRLDRHSPAPPLWLSSFLFQKITTTTTKTKMAKTPSELKIWKTLRVKNHHSFIPFKDNL